MPTRKIKAEAVDGRKTSCIKYTIWRKDFPIAKEYLILQRDYADLIRILALLQRHAVTLRPFEQPSDTGTRNTDRSRPSRKSGSRQKKNRKTGG